MSDIYVVLVITLLIWGGIFFYLLHLDKLMKNLNQKIDFQENLPENQR